MFTDTALDKSKVSARIKSMKDPNQLQEFIDKYSVPVKHKDGDKLME